MQGIDGRLYNYRSTGWIIWKVIIAILLFFGIQILLGLLISPLLLLGIGTFSTGNSLLVLQILSSVVTMAVFIPWFFMENKYNRYELIPRKGDAGVLSFVMIFVGTYAASFIGTGITNITGLNTANETYDETFGLLTDGNPVLAFIALAVCAPILEEIVFRGIVYRNLRERLGFWASALITALIFGLVHMDPYQIAAVLPLGFFFCYLYERFRKLWVPMLGHAINNALATISIYALKDIETNDIETNLIGEFGRLETIVTGVITLILGLGIAGLVGLYYQKSKYPKNIYREKQIMLKNEGNN